MFLVIVSSWLHKIGPVVCAMDNVYEVKKKGARLFVYVDSDKSTAYCINRIKKYIRHYVGTVFVFEVYGMFNGKADLLDYLPVEMKKANKYYNTTKDLYPEEEEAFFNAHPELKKQ